MIESRAIDESGQASPRLKIPNLSLATWADWEFAYDNAIERHFFLSPHWGRVVEATYQIKPRIFRFQFPTQDVVLPCFVTRRVRGVFHGARSMAPYQYGGLLCDRPLDSELTEGVAMGLRREWLLHTLYVSSSPLRNIIGWDKYQVGAFSTQVLDLSGGYPQVWKHRIDSAQRNKIRKAQRSGINVRKDSSREALESLFNLYLMTCDRLGVAVTNQVPRIFFEKLILTREKSIDLWLASKDGHDIASVIVANNDRDAAHYLLNASDARYWKYSPNSLLLAVAIEEACERGFCRFDFMPSNRIPSLERYKKSFGAIRTPVASYMLKGLLPSMKDSWITTYKRFVNSPA